MNLKMNNIGNTPYYLNSNATKDFIKKEIEELEKLWGLK
jgi:hypothetical protein